MADAFGRDPVLEQRIRQLVREHNIKTVVETGTWRGYTTRRFCEFVSWVFTIESVVPTWQLAHETLYETSNVTIELGDSAKVLPTLARHPCFQRPVLYYLDAHWHDEWPLPNEIEAIANMGDECVIVVHDCMVPNTDLQYDSYGGQLLTFEFLKPLLDKLHFPWRYSFNDETAQGHRRGCLFVEPEQW